VIEERKHFVNQLNLPRQFQFVTLGHARFFMVHISYRAGKM